MKLIRRFLVLILTFILFFSISAPYYIFASDITASTSSDPAGWDSWSLNEKQDYLQHFAWNIVCSVTGLVHGDSEAMKNIILDLYASRPESGVTNFYEYLANGLSFDDDNRTWELSDDLVDFFNALIVDYNDRVTMVYRYPLNKANIDASEFDSKVWFDAFCDLLDAFPDYYFYFDKTTHKQGPYFNINSQSVSYPCYSFFVVKDPFAGVNAYPDLMTTPVYLYNQNLTNSNNVLQLYVISEDNFVSSDKIHYVVYKGWNAGVNGDYYATLDDLKAADLIFSKSSSDALSMCNQFSWKRGVSSFTAYSAKTTPINVYKTVADMKKDIGSQFIGRYSDGYTGTTINNVSQDTINNIVNNYYPKDPDVDPDDPDSGSSSIKKILNDILDEIKESNKHLEKIIKQLRLNNFLTGVDTILDALDLFYDVLNGELSDLASNIFSDNADQFNAVSGQLSKKFPFSLPYDLQAILYILVAEPVDPVFDIPFKAGSSFSSSGYLIDETIHLDFTDFSQSVSVLHFFIKLYWIVALLLLTPKVIHRNGGA